MPLMVNSGGWILHWRAVIEAKAMYKNVGDRTHALLIVVPPVAPAIPAQVGEAVLLEPVEAGK